MFSKNKDSNQSLENINKSFISKRVDGLKSVALLSAVALTMLSGCVSDKEYQEVKNKNEELSSIYIQYRDADLALYREYNETIEKYDAALNLQDEQLREDMVNFINEYNDYCENTSFDFEDYNKYVCNGYKAKINEYVDYFNKFLNHHMPVVKYRELDAKLDDAQETFGALKGYVNAINVEKNIQNSNQEEYELGLE